MITVKLYAYLREKHGKQVDIPFEEGMKVKDIVERLGLPKEKLSLIVAGDKDGMASRMMDVPLRDDMLVHIFPPVAGG